MANDTSRRRKFYDQMSESYDLGSFEEFDKKMNDAASRKRLHEFIDKDGKYDIGTFEYFDEAMKPAGEAAGTAAKPSEPEDGHIFTDSQMDGKGSQAQQQERDYSQPMDLSRPQEYQIPTPFKAGAEAARQIADSPDLNKYWAGRQQEAVRRAMEPEDSASNFEYRMQGWQEAGEADAARRMKRGEYDKEHFEGFYEQHVAPSFSEERESGDQRAREAIRRQLASEILGNVPDNPSGVMSGIGRTFRASVAVERETDPEKIAQNTLQRVEEDDAFGDYVLSRMGINGQTVTDGEQGESEPLTEEEKKGMQLLFARENAEVADMIIQRIYDQYKAEGAPQGTLEYIAGKAFHENFAATLFDALVRRAANSSGLREQLRAMSSEEYGQSLEGLSGWATRMAGAAAPFAVDILTGGFAAPSAVGNALMKGGMRLAAKEVTKEMGKRAAARGLEDAALKEAIAGGAGIAERYLATQAPILNLALRTAGSAANFATYDVQSEAVRQLAEGEFNAGNIISQAIHGAILGTLTGGVGGTIAHATRHSALATKIASDIAGVGAETGIFAAANGIAKAQEMGIDITDVDWADTTGEALGMVVGMKTVGTAMHPRTFLNRYRQSNDLGLQLNQRDLDELKQAGYDFDGIIKGLGKFGEVAPESATITRQAAEYAVDADGKRSQRNTETKEAYVDAEVFNAILNNPEISSSVKRKLTYIATGKVLSLEPVFGATMNVDENGRATIITRNAYGNIIETKDYESQEAAQKDYEAIQEMARANTIGGLERIADVTGFNDVTATAKSRTEKETGVDVDNLDQLSELEPAEANKILDAYIRNLQDVYQERFGESMEHLTAQGRVALTTQQTGQQQTGQQQAEQGQTGQQRTERRQAAYERGASVVDDESQMANISYGQQLAEARLDAVLPDSDPVAARLKGIIRNGSEEEIAAIMPQLNEQQREAVEQLLDFGETQQGVNDAVRQQSEAYRQQLTDQMEPVTRPDGYAQPLVLKSGETVYHMSGDFGVPMASVTVVNENGEARQISTSEIAEIQPSFHVADKIVQDVNAYTDQLIQRYQQYSDGSRFMQGQQVDLAIEGTMIHFTIAGQDAAGHLLLQDKDGKTIPMPFGDVQKAYKDANALKIQAVLQEEKQAEATRQRTERFNAGIVGYKDGTPDLTAKDTKPDVAAEYLLSQVDGEGKPIDRKQVLNQIQTQAEQSNAAYQQAQQDYQMATNRQTMAEDGDADALRQQTEQLAAQMESLRDQRRKWGEIRQAMMNNEERQSFEKDRIKAVNGAKTQSKKDYDAQAATMSQQSEPVPTVKELMDTYETRGEAEDYIEGRRKQLSQAYKNDVYPKWDDIQKQLNDYQRGLTDLTGDEIKALTDAQTAYEAQMAQMVKEQEAWKKLLSDSSRAYGVRERQQMTPHELAMSRLANETDKRKKMELAQEAFKDDPAALAVLENTEPQDIYEFVAANLGAGSINWEGIQRGEHHVRGLQEEMGKDKTRGVGAQYDTNAFNYFLAPTGQGKGIEEIAHNMAEGSPYDTQDIKNAIRDMLSSATKPTDISHYIENNRIAEAERIYLENQERERDAEIEAENEAIREMAGMEPEEYDAVQRGVANGQVIEVPNLITLDKTKIIPGQVYVSKKTDAKGYTKISLGRVGVNSKGKAVFTGPSTNGVFIDIPLTELIIDEDYEDYFGEDSLIVEDLDFDSPYKVNEIRIDPNGNIVGTILIPNKNGGYEKIDARLRVNPTDHLSNDQLTSKETEVLQKSVSSVQDSFNRTPPSTPEEAHSVIQQVIDFARNVGDEIFRKVVSGVTERQKNDLSKEGIAIDSDYVHSVESTKIRHNQQRHGNVEAEAKKGQVAITDDDYLKIPDILENYDKVKKSDNQNNQGLDVLIYTKEYPDGTIYYLEEVRSKRKSLAFETMYKKKNGTDSSDGLMPKTSPLTSTTTPDNLNSDGKVTNNSGEIQEKGKKSSIQGLEGYSEDEIKDIVRDFVNRQVADNEVAAEIVDMKVVGSRTTGDAKEDSDLDVLLEYKGKEREDDFFNLLHDADEPLVIDGITVDINPITKGKSGTLVEYMKRNEAYDEEKNNHDLQVVKDSVAEFSKKYHPLAPIAVISVNSNNSLKRIYNDIVGEELQADEMEAFRQGLKESKLPAAYAPVSGKIYIFAENIEEGRSEEWYFHENLHRGWHQYYGDNPNEIAEAFWETTSPTNSDATERHKRAVSEKYADEPENIKEEYLTHLLAYHMAKGNVGKILSRMSAEHQEITKNILQDIGYDTAEEARRRRPEGGTDKEVSPEDTHLSAGGDRRGVDDTLSHIGYDRSKETVARRETQEVQEVAGGQRPVSSDEGTTGDLMNAPFADRLMAAKGGTNTQPTEEQKKAGNYKMGHVSFGGYRMSIENPKGSVRSGFDKATNTPWSIEMQDTYGYIGKKYGTDGDHLDFFINDDADLDSWNGRVYVVDQKNEDGSFDEHKVMYGYPTWRAARRAYERNYEAGWWDKHVMQMTGMRKENFDKWLAESDHKTKPFAEYARTRHSETVSSPAEQLMADVEERKGLKPAVEAAVTVTPSFKQGELEAKSADELRQLKKKKKQDLSTSRVILVTTNVQPGSLKERTLKERVAQSEADIAAIDAELEKKGDEMRRRADQTEIGGAMVDQLESMGFDVATNPTEMRRARKEAEKDQSEEGKMRHYKTPDGQIYGFTYKGKMYLDIRKIDAELPIHEYAHPWCAAIRRLNPEGWKRIVGVMKGDKDTWGFVKQVNPDLTNDDDIAEEMIAKFSGQRGAERAQAEYERMNSRDPDYKGKWGNIWKNISKAIQDFWKQVGDFLHIKYESAEQVYDQVVRDFANKVNPRKRVEQWLKERDAAYMEAVEKGDETKVKELFDEALRENVGNGITPFIAVDGYRGKMQKLAHGVKSRDAKVIAEVADLMAPLIPKDAVLVPAPSHSGKATDMLDLAKAISKRTGAPVADVLTSKERGSQYAAKYAGQPISSKDMGITVSGELPAAKLPVVIDNVVDTGNTAEACVQALGKGIVASLADSADRYRHVASLKSAEPIVVDKNGNVVPLSKRFEIGGKYLEKGVKPAGEAAGTMAGEDGATPVVVNDADSLIHEIERRKDAADRKQADEIVKTYLSRQPKTEDGQVRQRATKAVLRAMDNAGVPYKVVSKEEEKQMMRLFSLMNQEAIKELARRPSMRSMEPHGMSGTYIVYNMSNPFGIPIYFEKLSTAKYGLQGMKNLIPEGDWAMLKIGLPGEEADQDVLLKRAAEVRELMQMMGGNKKESDPATALGDESPLKDAVVTSSDIAKVVKNLETGIKSLKKIADGAEEVPNAMHRDDLSKYGGDGSITFVYGKTGDVSKDFKGGYGISHIGGKHGPDTLLHVLAVIANGEIDRYVEGNKTVVLTDGEYEVVLGLTRFGEKETWLFNGWRKEEKTGADGEVSTHSDATQANPTFSREDLGAVLSDAKIQKVFGLSVNISENPIADINFMTGWHGSGAKFDAFDHRYMGSGEGNQSYGWGTYITEVEGIGKMYAETMGSRKSPASYKGITSTSIALMSPEEYQKLGVANEKQKDILAQIVGSCNFGYGDPVRMIRVKRESLQELLERKQAVIDDTNEQLEEENLVARIEHMKRSDRKRPIAKERLEEAEKHLERLNNRIRINEKIVKETKELLDFVNSLDPKDFKGWSKPNGSYLYKVDIPEDNGSNYFDWTENMPEERAGEILAELREILLADDKYRWNENEKSIARLDQQLEAMKGFFGETFYWRMATMLGNSAAGAHKDGHRMTSELLGRHGYVGIKYPANYRSGGTMDGAKNYVIFNEDDAKITETIQFMFGDDTPDGEASGTDAPIFVSNALKSVEGIKQEKATPQQWIAMLEKAGGLKAGEDKWLGLREQLEDAAKLGLSITKDALLNYIRGHQIQVEEVHYSNSQSDEWAIADAFNKEFYELQKQAYDEDADIDVDGQIHYAWDEMCRRYGAYDIFGFDTAFRIDDYGRLEVYNYNDAVALANKYKGLNIKPISEIRLAYTTKGLKNKKEIVLVVPTVESYNEYDRIHFGDAGGGRAVAWVRFGEKETYDSVALEEFRAAEEELYDYLDRMSDKYETNLEEIEGKMTPEEIAEHERIMANFREKEAVFDATRKRVLVIDEIQSKRHQDGRERGYKTPDSPVEKRFAAQNAMDADNDKSKSYDVPDAPFEKNWHELAMKRMLRYAAENGYDKVAWTTGEQQAERYNIGKVVDDIEARPYKAQSPSESDGHNLFVHQTDGTMWEMFVQPDGTIDSDSQLFDGKKVGEVFGKDIANKIANTTEGVLRLDDENLRIGGDGMKGFYDEILVRFMNKYGKKWGVKVGEVEIPGISTDGTSHNTGMTTMWSIDVTPEMKESVMQGQPMFQKEGKKILGWSDGNQVFLTQAGLNPNTPLHECTHLWDKWCKKEQPELWKKLVSALKKTAMWEEIKNNPNYRNIWNDEDRMASEVHSRLTGATGEDEFMKAAFKKNTPQSIINEVKSVLRKFWEALLRLFNKHSKTIADDFESLASIVRMPIRDLVNQDFEKVMRVAEGQSEGMVEGHIVEDKAEIARLDKEPTEVGYRNVVMEEVADDWVARFKDRGVEFDIIPPKLLPILAGRGVEILPPHKGTGKDCQAAYESWKAEAQPQRTGQGYDLMRSKGKGKRNYPSVENLNNAVNLIHTALKKQRGGQLEIAVPSVVNKKAERILKHGIVKHYIDISGLNHGYNNHGEGGRKLQEDSIPLTKHDMELAPYILMSPDNVIPGSDNDGIGSVRYIKYLSNGKVVYIEAEGNLDGTELVSKNMWATMSPHTMPPSKVVDARSENAPKLTSDNVILSEDAAKIRKDAETAIENDRKMREQEQNSMRRAAEQAAEALGGTTVKAVTGEDIEGSDKDAAYEQLHSENESGTLGIYDPNTGEVTLFLDNIEDVDEAVRTVFHENLGHEGLVALLGSQAEVIKFGEFIFKSAGKTLRQRIMAKADDEDPEWKKGDRFSAAAQEVFADIAADGPRTAEEFDIWTKVKHYIIRFCNKMGWKIRGLVNDKDLRYYVLKTGEALKKWDAMSREAQEELSTQADQYEILRSRGGKPRKRRNESDAQFFQRLRAWEKWKVARDNARDNGDPEPEEATFHEEAEAAFRADLQAWKEQNGIPAGETGGTGAYPRRAEGETPQEYALRVAEYESKSDLWKTAPNIMDYLAHANEEYRRAYTAWRERYDLEEETSIDQHLYEGDVESEPTYTDADVEAEARAERDLAEAAGMEVAEAGAKRHAKLAIIERRKNMESSNAEDAIWVYDFVKQTEAVAETLSQHRGLKVTGKEIRKALPFLIEADRRKENMEAEREDAVMAINMSKAIQHAHTFIDYRNLDEIGEEVNVLNEAWERQVALATQQAGQEYREAAARLADKLNALNDGMAGYNKLFADDVMQIRGLLTQAVNAGRGDVLPEHAKRFDGVPEVQQLMEHVKAWYDEFYQLLEDAGLRGDAGYIGDGYVNHVWDKEKSDPSAWKKYVENRQRTKSPNMRHREIDTYMDGISIGLVPKYTDIADMIAHYSRQNNEAVANRRFLDDLQFVVVQEMNDAGEVTAILPLIATDNPDSFTRERYTLYYVPGVGDVYVLKHIQDRFANIFGTMRTRDTADWLSDFAKGYDLVSSTAKKIQLALSGFHALALFEVDMAQMGPATALKHLFKYIIVDSIRSRALPAYAHQEDFQLAAKHLVQLGATEDYAAADVNAITQKLRDSFKEWSMDDEAWKKAAGTVGSPVAILMDWLNKGFDKVLWNYLHDGLKLCAFKELAKQVDRRVAKEGLDGAMREQLLDEAGQYVNDMFGGQYWELINISPATLKWMRRIFLSPDWLLSTQRHFCAIFGFGSVYSDGGFREYIRYNSDNIKRLFGKEVPHDEVRRLRSKNAKYCYLVGATIWWGLFYNAINALCRWKDEEDEKAKAEEERQYNPNYKSPYELAYPDGMKWYDYTMYGNAIGQKTHLFTGRYSDGTETYVRWGKQFREFPELFIGRHGLEFPAPIIERMKGKANPNIGTLTDVLGAQNIYGFDGGYENKELREKYGKTIATLAAVARHFIPFGMSTQAEKEYKWLDFFMPSSKGFSRWKAKDYFETFIMDGDWDGIEATYHACVMNGIDADVALDAAIASIKAVQKRELSDGVSDLSTAAAKYDAAITPEEKILYHNKIKKYLKAGEYNAFTREEAIEKVHDFLEGTDIDEKKNVRYIMLATSEDVIAEEKLRDLGRTAEKFKKKIDDAQSDEEYDALLERYGSWITISKRVDKAVRAINKSKKQLGGMHEDSIMNDIRERIRDVQEGIDELRAPQ